MTVQKRKVPLLPLRGMLVFPYMIIHLDIGREKSIIALKEAMMQGRQILLVTQKEGQNEKPMPNDIFSIGTIAEIKHLLKLPGGTIRILVEGLHRAKIEKYETTEPFYLVEIQEYLEDNKKTSEIEALARVVINKFEQMVNINKKISIETLVNIITTEKIGKLADLIASHLSLKVEDKQNLLDAIDIKERLEKLCDIIGREIEILEIEKKINTRVRKQIGKTQKEYYLREQLKAIQKELGEKDERAAEVEEYRSRIKKLKLPVGIKEKIDKEIERLEKMSQMVAESSVIRNYLDWLFALPWSKETKDNLNIDNAEKILEEDHFGLEKVKERILEYLSVRKLNNKIKGPILCLIGPPGVGKTSIARSIARSLDRKFVRISLGGMRDEAEIRGHRRTYIGAMPGRIIQSIRTVSIKNPVFLLDEIDKMSEGFRGDPAAALLEILDPEQNIIFSDNYIEIPFDLSCVLWIATANAIHNIPKPLLDRMEIINISGYTEDEKIQIARRYLIQKQIKNHGLNNKQIIFVKNIIQKIIFDYTREAGVRNLEKNIANLCRKVARKIAQNTSSSIIKINAKNLHLFLGPIRYRYIPLDYCYQIGVANGLAWTEAGGEVLNVEVSVMKGKGKLTMTGQLGEVMQESAQAGLSYIRTKFKELRIDENFNEKIDIHIHLPQGAIPKDGPSAGITMALALISALTKKAIRKNVAMTGEITLRGRVLAVGGIKEKVLAAHRAGINKIILPKENKRDLNDIPNNLIKIIEFIFIEHMDEALKSALVINNEYKK